MNYEGEMASINLNGTKYRVATFPVGFEHPNQLSKAASGCMKTKIGIWSRFIHNKQVGNVFRAMSRKKREQHI